MHRWFGYLGDERNPRGRGARSYQDVAIADTTGIGSQKLLAAKALPEPAGGRGAFAFMLATCARLTAKTITCTNVLGNRQSSHLSDL